MKNVNVHHYLFLSETYEPVARGTNTNRNKEKVMRSLFLASTSWLENVCYLAKEIINAKIV